jgi:hypothetical protein
VLYSSLICPEESDWISHDAVSRFLKPLLNLSSLRGSFCSN